MSSTSTPVRFNLISSVEETPAVPLYCKRNLEMKSHHNLQIWMCIKSFFVDKWRKVCTSVSLREIKFASGKQTSIKVYLMYPPNRTMAMTAAVTQREMRQTRRLQQGQIREAERWLEHLKLVFFIKLQNCSLLHCAERAIMNDSLTIFENKIWNKEREQSHCHS